MAVTRVVICTQDVVFPQGKYEKGPFDVVLENGLISSIATCQGHCSDDGLLNCALLSPGFVDIHNHGMGGAEDVTDFWTNPGYTKKQLAQNGTTSFLATVVFLEHPLSSRMKNLLETLDSHVGCISEEGAVLEGIHSEGPIVTDLGGLPGNYDMTINEFEQLLDSMPHLKIMTISPHAEACIEYARMKCLIQRSVVPSLGHDKQASEEEILEALSLSKTQQFHLTHLFNVCTFHHRSPGLVNFGLLDQLPFLEKYKGIQTPTVEVIGDLTHVGPLAISLLLKCRHFQNITFVTDCVVECIPGKKIKYGNREMEVSPEGNGVSILGTNILAGSCSALLETFHSLVRIFGVPIGEAVAMLSENPARVAKIPHTGVIKVGKRADLLLFDSELNLLKTVVAGQVIPKRN